MTAELGSTRARAWPTWLALLIATTGMLLLVRPQVREVHVVLAYLLIVLGGSAAAGRALGITLSALGFLCVNYFFIQPYYTLRVADPLEWLVLAAFLVTAIVAAQLLARAQERGELARERAVEIQRLAGAAERAEAFRQADELKTTLIATVSHDLRTPLTTIKALAHDLAARGDEDALSIEEEADRLNRFVADLLDLSRLSAGSLHLRSELNVIDDLIGSALDRVRGATADRVIHVRRTDGREADEPLLVGRFDFVQTLRAVVNLLENALKYAPPDEPIEIALAREDDQVAITVEDRGPGVPEGAESRIFEPFFRPPGAPADAGGAGLGLAIARGLAAAEGGTLTYAPRPGGGARFTLRLPAADVSQLAGIHELFTSEDG